jgi:ribosomal protein S8
MMQRSSVITAPPPPTAQLLKSAGFSNLTTSQILRAIYITNINNETTLKDIGDFFSYCGNIEKVIQAKDPNSQDELQLGCVVMDNDHDYATALLLSGALIENTPIQVYPYRDLISITMAAQKPANNYQEHENRSAQRVINAIIKAGYISEPDIVDKITSRAVRLDETETSQERINLALKYATGRQRNDNDAQLVETLNTVRETATSFGSQVMNSEAVKTTSDFFSRGWGFLKTQLIEATGAPSPNNDTTPTVPTPQKKLPPPPIQQPPVPQKAPPPIPVEEKKKENLIDFD